MPDLDQTTRIYAKLFPLNCERDGVSQPCKPCCIDCGNYHKCMDKWKQGLYTYCITDRKHTYCRTLCKLLGYHPRPENERRYESVDL